MLCMRVYERTGRHTCVHACVHTYIRVCTHRHTCMCAHGDAHTHVCMRMHTHTHTQIYLKINLRIRRLLTTENCKCLKNLCSHWPPGKLIKYEVTITDSDMFMIILSGFPLVQGKPTYFWKKSNLFFICNMS